MTCVLKDSSGRQDGPGAGVCLRAGRQAQARGAPGVRRVISGGGVCAWYHVGGSEAARPRSGCCLAGRPLAPWLRPRFPRRPREQAVCTCPWQAGPAVSCGAPGPPAPRPRGPGPWGLVAAEVGGAVRLGAKPGACGSPRRLQDKERLWGRGCGRWHRSCSCPAPALRSFCSQPLAGEALRISNEDICIYNEGPSQVLEKLPLLSFPFLLSCQLPP